MNIIFLVFQGCFSSLLGANFCVLGLIKGIATLVDSFEIPENELEQYYGLHRAGPNDILNLEYTRYFAYVLMDAERMINPWKLSKVARRGCVKWIPRERWLLDTPPASAASKQVNSPVGLDAGDCSTRQQCRQTTWIRRLSGKKPRKKPCSIFL